MQTATENGLSFLMVVTFLHFVSVPEDGFVMERSRRPLIKLLLDFSNLANAPAFFPHPIIILAEIEMPQNFGLRKCCLILFTAPKQADMIFLFFRALKMYCGLTCQRACKHPAQKADCLQCH